MSRVVWPLFLCILCACEPGTQRHAPEPRDAAGEVTFAVGPEIRSIPYHRARCETSDDGQRIVLTGVAPLRTRAATYREPDVIIAHLPPDGRFDVTDDVKYGATLFAPNVDFEGVEHEMLMLVAKRVEGASPKVECTLETTGATRTLVCNEATVLPWKIAGPVPTGGFKVTFECTE